MNTLCNNLVKQCIAIFLVYSIAATSCLRAMKPDLTLNNRITVINEHNDLTSLMSLAHTQTELLPPSSPKSNITKINNYGILYPLNTPQTIHCSTTKHDIHDCPALGICNPHTKKKFTVQAIYSKDDSSLKMHYHPKRIVLTTKRNNYSFLQIYNAGLDNRAILLVAHDNDIITIKKGKNGDIRIIVNGKKIEKGADYIEY